MQAYSSIMSDMAVGKPTSFWGLAPTAVQGAQTTIQLVPKQQYSQLGCLVKYTIEKSPLHLIIDKRGAYSGGLIQGGVFIVVAHTKNFLTTKSIYHAYTCS